MSVLGSAAACASGTPSPEGPELAGTASSTGAVATGANSGGDATGSDDSPDPDSGYESGGGPGCGNGLPDPGEECDDGNLVNADGCNADCRRSGMLVWADTVAGGFGNVDEGRAVAAAADGTIFVAGYISLGDNSRDSWVRRYSVMGEPLWTQSHAGAGGANDEIRGLLLDGGGGVLYATGYQSTATTGLDAWLRSYNLQGGEIWTRTYNGPADGTDVFHDADFDALGNIVVGGYHGVPGEGADVLLRKYSVDGTVLWTRTYSAGNGGNDLVNDLAISAAGHIYVVGHETGMMGEGFNAWLAKYDTDGNLLWTRSYNGPASLDDFLVGVEVVGDDDVVVCGYASEVEQPWHSFVRRYDSLGMIVWTDHYQGQTEEGAHCFGVARDSDDNLVITGGELEAGVRGVLLRKYDLEGSVWWTRIVPGGDVGPDYGRRISFGPDDEIVASGTLNSGRDERDIWVGVFTP